MVVSYQMKIDIFEARMRQSGDALALPIQQFVVGQLRPRSTGQVKASKCHNDGKIYHSVHLFKR